MDLWKTRQNPHNLFPALPVVTGTLQAAMVTGLAVDAAGFAPGGGGVVQDSQLGGGGVGGGALNGGATITQTDQFKLLIIALITNKSFFG